MSKIIVRRQEYANNGTHANEIEAVVKENLIANTLSSATDIAPSVGLLKSLFDGFSAEDISPTVISQSSYGLSGANFVKIGNIMFVYFIAVVSNRETQYGGLVCYRDLPKPKFPFTQIFTPWVNVISTATETLRVYVNDNGTIGLRHGYANATYDVFLVYPLA